METSAGRLWEEVPNMSWGSRFGAAAQGDLPGCDRGSILETQFPPLLSVVSAGREGLGQCCVSVPAAEGTCSTSGAGGWPRKPWAGFVPAWAFHGPQLQHKALIRQRVTNESNVLVTEKPHGAAEPPLLGPAVLSLSAPRVCVFQVSPLPCRMC